MFKIETITTVIGSIMFIKYSYNYRFFLNNKERHTRTRYYCLALSRIYVLCVCVCVSKAWKSQINSSQSASNFLYFLTEKNKVPTLPKPKRVLFPVSNIHIGWKSLGRRWNVGSGMINMGNTCYLNSTLQAIFHVPSVASWLLSDVDHRARCCDNGKI